jgi:hypothetical protein
MAYTYSSWEYSQGPTLYIDSSGFKSIDDNKNFVYYYIVSYSPVEFRRKVTDDKGVSTYEFKYSFGNSNASRKVLEEVTFSGKEKVTKTVEHTVTEEGFTDTIIKTFYIDTNISNNLQTNVHITVNPKSKIDATEWTFDNINKLPADWKNKNYLGWYSVTETGYRTESYSYKKPAWVFLKDPDKYYNQDYWPSGDDVWGWGYDTTGEYWDYSYGTRTVSYSYTQVYNSYCKLNLKNIRDKIGDFSEHSVVTFMLKTEQALSKPPSVFLDTSTSSSTSLRKELTPKNAGSHSAGDYIEYYLPINLINQHFGNYNEINILIQKGSSNVANAYFTEAFVYVEIDASKIPYINLVVQAYNAAADKWFNACVIPYLNYIEIDELRKNESQVAKNLFLPEDLPKTDSSYRIQLDTNVFASDTELLTNLRIDVLSQQLIVPGSIEDRKLFLNNDTIDYEIEADEVNELKLNALGHLNYRVPTHPGFLKQGANDVHAYLKNSVFVDDTGIAEANKSKNIWHNYVAVKNGNWISNNIFVSNTFDFPQISLLKTNSNDNLKDLLVSFKIPYKSLKPYSTYTLKFEANATQSFVITNINTINPSDISTINKSTLFIESDADVAKASVESLEYIFYSPLYKVKRDKETEYVSEFNICDRDIPIEIKIKTKNILEDDEGYLTLNINRYAIKNILLKGIHCICEDNNGVKYLDVTEPYNISSTSGRQLDTNITMYYDGFHVEQINPLLYKDMMYLREQLNKIRKQYTIEAYNWANWGDKFDAKGETLYDDYGHRYGVEVGQPLRAIHFNDVKACCVDTYEKLLALKPPVHLNTSPSMFRNNVNLIPLDDADPNKGYVLQHYTDKAGNIMEIDKYFPEWRKIVDLINRN